MWAAPAFVGVVAAVKDVRQLEVELKQFAVAQPTTELLFARADALEQGFAQMSFARGMVAETTLEALYKLPRSPPVLFTLHPTKFHKWFGPRFIFCAPDA